MQITDETFTASGDEVGLKLPADEDNTVRGCSIVHLQTALDSAKSGDEITIDQTPVPPRVKSHSQLVNGLACSNVIEQGDEDGG